MVSVEQMPTVERSQRKFPVEPLDPAQPELDTPGQEFYRNRSLTQRGKEPLCHGDQNPDPGTISEYLSFTEMETEPAHQERGPGH